jgi:hypothetical protein
MGIVVEVPHRFRVGSPDVAERHIFQRRKGRRIRPIERRRTEEGGLRQFEEAGAEGHVSQKRFGPAALPCSDSGQPFGQARGIGESVAVGKHVFGKRVNRDQAGIIGQPLAGVGE